ncbi:hypothetical protein [Cellulomonas sp. NPDC058312]|uniref:hypothetical protein n=1 Tax=Cellulomonas sp. NPDC058312 TaxID=3346441 RepID=UPI0036EEEC8C
MAVDEETQATVRGLWAVGARYGRPPAPVPEVDPWEADDPPEAAARRRLVVVLEGSPVVAVQLQAAGPDTVRVEDTVDLEVPRQDVVAVVDALLGGRARRRVRSQGPVAHVVALVLGNPLPSELEVVVDGDRTYRAPVLVLAAASGWFHALPTTRG